MPLLAGEVLDEAAAVYLNDSAKARWTHAILLPYLRSALTELQTELEDNDLPPIYELSATILVPANTVELALPGDFVFPISLRERAVGDTRWEDMDELSWEPDADREPKLNTWVFREGKVQFLGATNPREVQLKYLRSLSAVVNGNSVIEVGNAKGFLAARTAALASSFGGQATARGKDAHERANWFLRKTINSITKRLHDRPVRRRRYRWR